jgi:hypothetical protein
MTTENQSRQDIIDEEHLRLLSIFHYVRAGTTAFIACIPLIHVIIGIGLIVASHHVDTKPNEPPIVFIGWIFVGIGLLIIILGGTFAVLQYLVGRFISLRQHHTFCLVMAGINCLAIPYGTLAGIMTFIVLGRASVRAQFLPGRVFDVSSSSMPGTPPPLH